MQRLQDDLYTLIEELIPEILFDTHLLRPYQKTLHQVIHSTIYDLISAEKTDAKLDMEKIPRREQYYTCIANEPEHKRLYDMALTALHQQSFG
jgi:hypothetical protein